MTFLDSFLQKKSKNKRVFLDFASTTPISPKVKEVMENAQKFFANPSALYSEALFVKEELDRSKKMICEILNCQRENIIFTSGGTESNNLALLGVFEATKNLVKNPHFITSVIEHPSILEVFKEIEKRGGEVSYLSVNNEGFISLEDLKGEIKENTVLISIMYANNEIGTIEPIKEIGRIIKEYRRKNEKNFPYFHSDACQSALYLELDVIKLNVDLLTLDGIKMYGPRGAGILYKKSNVELSPVLFGGGQQNNLRSGTESLASALGLATALKEADEIKETEVTRLLKLRDYAKAEIEKNFLNATLNGSIESRLPNNLNYCFAGIDSEFITISLDVAGVCVSYSSSCRTLKEDSSSYVVESLGKDNCQMSSLRFTFGRETTKKDIDFLISALKKVIK